MATKGEVGTRQFKVPVVRQKVDVDADVVVEVDRWRGGIPRCTALAMLVRAGLKVSNAVEGSNGTATA